MKKIIEWIKSLFGKNKCYPEVIVDKPLTAKEAVKVHKSMLTHSQSKKKKKNRRRNHLRKMTRKSHRRGNR